MRPGVCYYGQIRDRGGKTTDGELDRIDVGDRFTFFPMAVYTTSVSVNFIAKRQNISVCALQKAYWKSCSLHEHSICLGRGARGALKASAYFSEDKQLSTNFYCPVQLVRVCEISSRSIIIMSCRELWLHNDGILQSNHCMNNSFRLHFHGRRTILYATP